MRISAGTSRRTTVAFVALVAGAASVVACTPEEIAAVQAWGRKCHKTHSCTTTTPPTTTTTTTLPTTTTRATTTTAPPTTTTQPGSRPAFLSYPHQSGPQSFSGANVTVSARSYVAVTPPPSPSPKAALTIHDCSGTTTLHDLDFDGNVGDIFVINCTGTLIVTNVRARNTGGGSIGSGGNNVIQLNNWHGPGTINHIDAYGGHTEDMISIFQSGGTDTDHRLLVANNRLESPLTGTLAWTSNSGTCINVGDAGGGNVTVADNSLLNCGAVGAQLNVGSNVRYARNVIYGAARPQSNVGLSQWASSPCSSCSGNEWLNNRVWWVKADGSASSTYDSHTAGTITKVGNVLQDTTIDPNSMHVAL